jgi:Uma2 family endonuclease
MTEHVIKERITEADLMRPEVEDFEVIKGEWVEENSAMMGFLHTTIIDNLVLLIKPFVVQQRLGMFHGDGVKYVLHTDEHGIQTAYKPDCAFLRKGRLPADFDPNRPFYGAPDLAVEVLSPGQSTPDMLNKIADYLRYGSEEAWLIYPAQRQLHRYRSSEDTPPEIYRDSDTLQPETLFPGLMLPIAALFVIETQ